jgi:dipeptidyl aminopeptidase/acylaminoacyl peptidase
MATGVRRDIAKGALVDWTPYQSELPDAVDASDAPIAWFADEPAALVHDQFDIWKLDLTGKRSPVNITNGYGRTHHVIFSVSIPNPVHRSDTLLLTAFNRDTKDNGWFRKRLNQAGDPEQLTMGPYLYQIRASSEADVGINPIKARDAAVYIVQRMSAEESPNYFLTRDFKSFRPLSDVHPEADYNWLTTELVTWTLPDGSTSQGILYKPENFSPQEKYPLIFYFYMKLADNLHRYLEPSANSGQLPIPSYVSRGYLVFTPDIHYRIGEPGFSALDSIVSAAELLASRPYVDGAHMGISGHSFGAYEADFIATHSTLFAAVFAASGVSDLISDYGAPGPSGGSKTGYYERSQGGMRTTPWQTPDLYLENSPVLSADKVTTPILLMADKKDTSVPYTQGIEFFTALRRLGKKAWLLQYDEGDHSVEGARNILDFDTRVAQFFDHYLLDVPPPKWMTIGIPARLKGIDSGLELDTSGRQP